MGKEGIRIFYILCKFSYEINSTLIFHSDIAFKKEKSLKIGQIWNKTSYLGLHISVAYLMLANKLRQVNSKDKESTYI